MTDGETKTPRERAAARVRALLEEATREAADAGYVIGFRLGDIVSAVEEELGDAALRLSRYYPDDEGSAVLLGPQRRIDPDTGKPPNLYVMWRTGLPNGRVHVQFTNGGQADPPVLAECTAAPDSLGHVLRVLLAACEHSAGTAAVPAGDGAE